MKIRYGQVVVAAVVLMFGAQRVGAQQIVPGPAMDGYSHAMTVAYPATYMAAIPPQFDVRQVALTTTAGTGHAGHCSGGGGCDGSGCRAGGGCDGCSGCCGSGGVTNCWCHRVAVWGEYLYLRPRSAEVAYGVPIDGSITPAPTNPIQVGRVGTVDPDYSTGIRFGGSYVLNGRASLTAQYTWFESGTDDQINTTAPNVIGSLVSHPGTLTAAQDFRSAQASQRLRFDWLDVDYRRAIDCSDNRLVTFLVGARLGQFNQDFDATFSASGTETVETEIDFYGAGLRLGLEGERYTASRRWLIYGKSAASLVAGEFTADYRQGQTFDPTVVDTSWQAGRVMPILDLELGAGWQSRCGTWRITGGYMVSAWFNAVTTDEWIRAVHHNDFVGLSDGFSLDGFVLRCEGRF